MPDSAASPVAEAIYALFQDATLQAATPGGWHDDVPQAATLPVGWIEIVDERDVRGFGTGGLPEVEIRTHVWSQFGGMAEAQTANRLAISLLKDAALTVTGYAMCGHVFYRDTVTLPDELLGGVKVHEIVSRFTLFVEES